jgi:lipoprotein-anchoring transpeptidase ErfK/SrfK
MVTSHLLVFATMLTIGQQAPPQRPPSQKPAAHANAPQAKPKPLSKAEQAREKVRLAKEGAEAKKQQLIALQVALDRAGFSTGVVDGREGSNTTRALDAYRKQKNNDPQPTNPAVITYQITDQDAAGPFEEVPSDLMEQSKLPALSYRSVTELIAERFHTTPEFLQAMNPSAKMTAGESLTVPNVEPFVLPTKDMSQVPAAAPKATGTAGRRGAPKPTATAGTDPLPEKPPVTITVSKALSSLTVTDEAGKVLFFGPVTTGSEHDPLPLGEWKVTSTHFEPPFAYNPALFWDANPTHSKATIPPGPNGPVGVVWIDLSKEHYGIHGTPEPSTVGKTQSHGCVRLTNWDATRVATLVTPGTLVRFVE